MQFNELMNINVKTQPIFSLFGLCHFQERSKKHLIHCMLMVRQLKQVLPPSFTDLRDECRQTLSLWETLKKQFFLNPFLMNLNFQQ